MWLGQNYELCQQQQQQQQQHTQSRMGEVWGRWNVDRSYPYPTCGSERPKITNYVPRLFSTNTTTLES